MDIEKNERQNMKIAKEYDFIDDVDYNQSLRLMNDQFAEIMNKSVEINKKSMDIDDKHNELLSKIGDGILKKSNNIYMNKSDLNKLSKSQLIKLLLKQEKKKPQIIIVDDTKPVVAPRTYKLMPAPITHKPLPTPITYKPVLTQITHKPVYASKTFRPAEKAKKSVKELVDYFERKRLPSPPSEWLKEIEQLNKPVKPPRTKKLEMLGKTEKTDKALKGYTESYKMDIEDGNDPLLQLQNTRKAVKFRLSKVLASMKGFKFVETLKVTFKKMSDGEMLFKTAYFNSPTQTIINDSEIIESLQVAKQEILNKIGVWISEGSGWPVESVDNHHLNVVKYQPMRGSSYIKLPQELRNSAKGLINMKNEDNECFRWCHIRHSNPQDKYPQRIKNVDKRYIEKLDYSGTKFPVTTKQYNKIEKQNSININVFGYEDKQPYPIYVSKEKNEDHMNLLLIKENENKHYVLIKDFNKLMYKQTKHKERKHFCMCCLQCFSSERVLTDHRENCIEINGAQGIKMPTHDNNVLKFNNFNKQLQVPFADFEAITEKIHGCKPNNDKSYTEAYQKHTDCGYGYKVVCCYDDKYTKPVQIYRGEKAVYKFIEAMLEEVKYCKKVMKKEFNKQLKMTKHNEDEFQKANKCHICEKEYNTTDVRVRDHCHITGQYRGSAHQDCNLNFQITDKIPVIFHNLRGYEVLIS